MPRPGAPTNACRCQGCDYATRVSASCVADPGGGSTPALPDCFAPVTPVAPSDAEATAATIPAGMVDACGINNVAMQRADANETILSCLTPDRSAAPLQASGRRSVLFLVGDSHAAALSGGMEAAAASRFGLVWVANLCGCSFGASSRPVFGCGADHCGRYIEYVNKGLAAQLHAGDVVAVSNGAWKMYTAGTSPRSTRSPESSHAPAIAAEVAFVETLAALVASRSASLLLLGDTAVLPRLANVPICRSPSLRGTQCSVDEWQWQGWHEAQAALAARLDRPHVHFLSLWDLLCVRSATGTHSCGPNIPGTNIMAFFDYDHLSVDGALFVHSFLCHFLYLHAMIA